MQTCAMGGKGGLLFVEHGLGDLELQGLAHIQEDLCSHDLKDSLALGQAPA